MTLRLAGGMVMKLRPPGGSVVKPHPLLALLIAVLTLAPGLRAQEETEEGPVLVGRVIDGQTGTPLLGAFISIQGEKWGVLSDERGHFALPGVPREPFLVEVDQLGYVDFLEEVEVADEGIVTLSLTPDPILLEGIEVVQDRFEHRRKAYAFASKVLPREELVHNASATLPELIGHYSFLRPFPCPEFEPEPFCALIRGQVRPVRVWIDEMPALGGLDYLNAIPPHELHRVEIYYSKGLVLAYTESFVERAGNRPIALMQLIW